MLLDATSASLSNESTTPLPVLSAAPSEWVEMSCEWMQQTLDAQNAAYRSQMDVFYVIIIYVVVCAFGCLANAVVLVVFARSPSLRSVRNWFIFNLACSDLLLCSFTAPATAYQSVMLFWPYGDVPCKVLASLQALNTFVSSLTLAVIALDRVLLTLSPLHWRMASTAPILCYLSIWLLSVIVALPYSIAVTSKPLDIPPWSDRSIAISLRVCNFTRPEICQELDLRWKLSYTWTVLAIQYVLPLLALAWAYTQIGSTIRRRGKTSTTLDASRRSSMQQRNRNAMVLLAVLVGNYAIFWAPVNVYLLLVALNLASYSQKIFLLCHVTGICSACVNPILYGLVNDAFQSALVGLLCGGPGGRGSRRGAYQAPTTLAAPAGAGPSEHKSPPPPPIPRDSSLRPEVAASLLTSL